MFEKTFKGLSSAPASTQPPLSKTCEIKMVKMMLIMLKAVRVLKMIIMMTRRSQICPQKFNGNILQRMKFAKKEQIIFSEVIIMMLEMIMLKMETRSSHYNVSAPSF